jgi:hypothetical protein
MRVWWAVEGFVESVLNMQKAQACSSVIPYVGESHKQQQMMAVEEKMLESEFPKMAALLTTYCYSSKFSILI